MKQRILVTTLTVALFGMVGCSSIPGSNQSSGGMDPGVSANTAVAEQRLAVSEFKKNGVRISYTLNGEVDSIEVHGYAAVWGNSMNGARESYRMAELEAKKSLNDFINKESIRTTTSVRMISQNVERATDNTNNKFSSNRAQPDELVAVDEEVQAAASDVNSRENAAVRNNALNIASRLNTTIVVNNSGILGGLYLKESGVVEDGKAVYVVMRWDRRSNASRPQLRKLMAM